MIDKIMDEYNKCIFDFRSYANPDDELRGLFSEWVDYYRMKFAIAMAVKPASILEIGVRYGYSAISFLSAAPKARFVGIDNNSCTFGGKEGSKHWAQKITFKYDTKFICADSQKMSCFPGEKYDLIHIDGQQDGDGTYNDLEKAIRKGRYILVDGYFWSKDNMLSIMYFTEKYRQYIESIVIIPGYAGECLIKVKEDIQKFFPESGTSYADLQEAYDSEYFMTDCGGYEVFKMGNGKDIVEQRFTSILNLLSPQPGDEILDVGCGRGELSYFASSCGANVTGVDYSETSIDIATKTYGNTSPNLFFFRKDVLTYSSDKKFNKVVAADFVEHVETSVLRKILKKISGFLTDDGVFLVHTAPNKHIYTKKYAKERQIAKSIGSYLPPSPRTYYEDLMHINEQTPESLESELKKCFSCVHVWTAALPNIEGSFKKGLSEDELLNHGSIIAVASNHQIEECEILSAVTQKMLKNADVKLSASDDVMHFIAGQQTDILISIKNLTDERFTSLQPHPVHLSYHWKNSNSEMVVFDGVRTPLYFPLLPGEEREARMDIIAPESSGDYHLEITMVQEGCFWFEKKTSSLPLKIDVNVK